MSRRSLLRKVPSNRHRARPSGSCLSLSFHRRRTLIPHRPKPCKPYNTLRRCNSEPIFCSVGFLNEDESQNEAKPNIDQVLVQGQTCPDIFMMSPSTDSSPLTNKKYNKDAKVVVNVTVEGSAGPVRILTRLGASVEETTRLAVDKYNEERRRPLLDKDSVASFKLHYSCFSLEEICKTEELGGIGTRTFYLRRSCNIADNGSARLVSSCDEAVTVDQAGGTSPVLQNSQQIIVSAFTDRKARIIGQPTCLFWRLFRCFDFLRIK